MCLIFHNLIWTFLCIALDTLKDTAQQSVPFTLGGEKKTSGGPFPASLSAPSDRA